MLINIKKRYNPWIVATVVSIVATCLYIIIDFYETGEVAVNRIAIFGLVFFAVYFFIQLSLNYCLEKT